jgi:hypothetical protein
MSKTRSPKNIAAATVAEPQPTPPVQKQTQPQADQGLVPRAPSAEESTLDVEIDGETLTLSAHKKITLRCGKASIVLNADGSIEIRGTELLSRASGQNAIRGASVSLN